MSNPTDDAWRRLGETDMSSDTFELFRDILAALDTILDRLDRLDGGHLQEEDPPQ